jgi:hypothetical protein
MKNWVRGIDYRNVCGRRRWWRKQSPVQFIRKEKLNTPYTCILGTYSPLGPLSPREPKILYAKHCLSIPSYHFIVLLRSTVKRGDLTSDDLFCLNRKALFCYTVPAERPQCLIWHSTEQAPAFLQGGGKEDASWVGWFDGVEYVSAWANVVGCDFCDFAVSIIRQTEVGGHCGSEGWPVQLESCTRRKLELVLDVHLSRIVKSDDVPVYSRSPFTSIHMHLGFLEVSETNMLE